MYWIAFRCKCDFTGFILPCPCLFWNSRSAYLHTWFWHCFPVVKYGNRTGHYPKFGLLFVMRVFIGPTRASRAADGWVHYNDVIMSAMASQITSLTIVYSTVYSRRRSKKTSKLRVTGPCGGNSPVTGGFPHKGPITRKMFPFDDVIMGVANPEYVEAGAN